MGGWWRRPFGYALLLLGAGLGIGSIFVSVDQVGTAEDAASAVEAGVILFLICLSIAAYGFRLAVGDRAGGTSGDHPDAGPSEPPET